MRRKEKEEVDEDEKKENKEKNKEKNKEEEVATGRDSNISIPHKGGMHPVDLHYTGSSHLHELFLIDRAIMVVILRLQPGCCIDSCCDPRIVAVCGFESCENFISKDLGTT